MPVSAERDRLPGAEEPLAVRVGEVPRLQVEARRLATEVLGVIDRRDGRRRPVPPSATNNAVRPIAIDGLGRGMRDFIREPPGLDHQNHGPNLVAWRAGPTTLSSALTEH